MATRGVAQTVEFIAWNTSGNAGKTGDGANFTMRWVKDGTSSALTTTTVTEIDSTNCPGLYKVSISSTEADCNIGYLHTITFFLTHRKIRMAQRRNRDCSRRCNIADSCNNYHIAWYVTEGRL